MDFKDIPSFPHCNYQVDIEWSYLQYKVDKETEEAQLDINPDFQRAHVWTEDQQIAYVEFRLKGGRTGEQLLFNCPGYVSTSNTHGPYVLVDGKQRLEAVLKFMRNELPIFGGHYRNDITGYMRMHRATFKWMVAELPTRAEVLEWYLSFNAGGTPHTKTEIDRVRKLLVEEKLGIKR